jgi:type III secretion protein U
MEQNKENKTEPPSKRKLRRARKKGEVAISRELAGACSVVAGFLALVFFWDQTIAGIGEVARCCWAGGEVDQWKNALGRLSSLVAVFGGFAAAGALLALGLQVGLRFRMKIDWTRLNPVKGLARMFSRQRLADLGLMLLKLSALGLLGFWVAGHLGLDLVSNWRVELVTTSGAAATVAMRTLCILGALIVLAGVLDRIVQRRRFLKRMRMTRREVLDERKEQEGDPAVKSERRRRHRQILNGVGFDNLRKASVVVVNPTHIAVALSYRRDEDEAPWVVTTGRGSQAARIRNEAVRLGIPVIQQVALARALARLDPGEEIPEELYQATSEVIRAVMDWQLQPFDGLSVLR